MHTRHNIEIILIMSTILSVIQIITSVGLIVLVLVQDRGEGIGEGLGGTQAAGLSHQRRGMEQTMHIITVVAVVIFAATSLALLLLH